MSPESRKTGLYDKSFERRLVREFHGELRKDRTEWRKYRSGRFGIWSMAAVVWACFGVLLFFVVTGQVAEPGDGPNSRHIMLGHWIAWVACLAVYWGFFSFWPDIQEPAARLPIDLDGLYRYAKREWLIKLLFNSVIAAGLAWVVTAGPVGGVHAVVISLVAGLAFMVGVKSLSLVVQALCLRFRQS